LLLLDTAAVCYPLLALPSREGRCLEVASVEIS
jgi:hypothetical protein